MAPVMDSAVTLGDRRLRLIVPPPMSRMRQPSQSGELRMYYTRNVKSATKPSAGAPPPPRVPTARPEDDDPRRRDAGDDGVGHGR